MALLQTEEGLAPLSGKARLAVAEMVAELVGFGAIYDQMKVSELYDELLAKTGYLAALRARNTVEDDVRVENLLEFRSAILESEREDPALTLADFLEKVALMADIDNHDREADAITVMTMHAAKGLEFPVVFMPGMEDGLFPNQRAIEDRQGVEEERRLCYVGMTRAEERLYLIRAKERTVYGRRDWSLESRFLKEIDTGTLDENGDLPGRDRTGYFHRDSWSSDFGRRPDAGAGAGVGRDAGAGDRPFDAMAAAQRDIARKAAAVRTVAPGELKQGDRVRHVKFGEGLVLETDGKLAVVMFDTEGRKKLSIAHTPMEKL